MFTFPCSGFQSLLKRFSERMFYNFQSSESILGFSLHITSHKNHQNIVPLMISPEKSNYRLWNCRWVCKERGASVCAVGARGRQWVAMRCARVAPGLNGASAPTTIEECNLPRSLKRTFSPRTVWMVHNHLLFFFNFVAFFVARPFFIVDLCWLRRRLINFYWYVVNLCLWV